MRPILAAAVLALLLGPQAAAAESRTLIMAQSASGEVAAAAKSAAEALATRTKDSLLVKDILGAPVTEPGGGEVGVVANFVVVPGGRIVAALIDTKSSGTGTVPVPFSAVKLSKAADRVKVELPTKLSELSSLKEVQDLKNAIPGL